VIWRRDPESNRAERICNPLHNRFAIAPKKREAQASLLPTLSEKAAVPLFLNIGKAAALLFLKLERAKSLELSTSTLARLRSTN